jgi:hypothetical protein
MPIDKPIASPERAMWCAVLSMAVTDATGTIRAKNANARKEAARLRNEARDWLLRDSRDFRLVCALAGFDAEAIRDAAFKLARRDWPSQKPSRIAQTLEGLDE